MLTSPRSRLLQGRPHDGSLDHRIGDNDTGLVFDIDKSVESTYVTDATSPIAEAAAALQRLNESMLSDRADDIANILDSLTDSDGPLAPLRDFLDSTAGWTGTLNGDEADDVSYDISRAVSSLDEAIDAIQTAAAGLRAISD